MPPDIEKNVNTLIDNKEFNTKSEVFVTALRFYFANRESNFEDKIEAFFLSERGKALMNKLIKNANSAKTH